jgi:O-antigen/teichoic acid export membrane protein
LTFIIPFIDIGPTVPSKKFVTDALWNYMAFAVMAVCGVIINFSLALLQGTTALGIFNQTMAYYVIVSHFAVLGFHNAVLYYVAAFPRNSTSVFVNACLPLILIAGSISLISYMAAPLISDLFDSEPLEQSLRYASIALVFFAFNKVALNFFNATKNMRIYAVGQTLRYVCILGVVLYLSFHDGRLGMLGIPFLVAEISVCIYLVFFLWFALKGQELKIRQKISRLSLRFSLQSVGAGLLNQINVQLDILMLGYFMSDRVVGLYSFAAIFVQGFYNAGLVVRNTLTPYVIKAYKEKKLQQMAGWLRKIYIFGAVLSATIFLAVFLLYDPIIIDLLGMTDFTEAKAALIILMAFMAIYFLFIPFEEFVLASGNPLHHTYIYIGVIVLNFCFNVTLIPFYGMLGAAFSTGAALMGMMLCVYVYAWRKLKINLFTGQYI